MDPYRVLELLGVSSLLAASYMPSGIPLVMLRREFLGPYWVWLVDSYHSSASPFHQQETFLDGFKLKTLFVCSFVQIICIKLFTSNILYFPFFVLSFLSTSKREATEFRIMAKGWEKYYSAFILCLY